MLFNSIRKPRAPRVIQLPEGYFQETYTQATPGTKIGIKRLSIGDLNMCHDEALRYEDNGFVNVEQSLMTNVVALALCDPTDVTTKYLKAGDIEARVAFTPEGLKYLYDVVLQLHLSTTSLYEEISDENLQILIKFLTTRPVSRKLRRILSYVLDEMAKLWVLLFRLLLKNVRNANFLRATTMILHQIRAAKTTKTLIVNPVRVNFTQNVERNTELSVQPQKRRIW